VKQADHSAALAELRAELVDCVSDGFEHRSYWEHERGYRRDQLRTFIARIRALDAVRQAANHRLDAAIAAALKERDAVAAAALAPPVAGTFESALAAARAALDDMGGDRQLRAALARAEAAERKFAATLGEDPEGDARALIDCCTTDELVGRIAKLRDAEKRAEAAERERDLARRYQNNAVNNGMRLQNEKRAAELKLAELTVACERLRIATGAVEGDDAERAIVALLDRQQRERGQETQDVHRTPPLAGGDHVNATPCTPDKGARPGVAGEAVPEARQSGLSGQGPDSRERPALSTKPQPAGVAAALDAVRPELERMGEWVARVESDGQDLHIKLQEFVALYNEHMRAEHRRAPKPPLREGVVKQADHSAALDGLRAELVGDLRGAREAHASWREGSRYEPEGILPEMREVGQRECREHARALIGWIRALDAVRQAANHGAHLLELLKARGESIGSIVAHNHEAGRRW
jgi:hypothetical protein